MLGLSLRSQVSSISHAAVEIQLTTSSESYEILEMLVNVLNGVVAVAKGGYQEASGNSTVELGLCVTVLVVDYGSGSIYFFLLFFYILGM
jgi:hypothetical protein